MGIFPFEDGNNYSPYIHSAEDLIGPSLNSMEQVGLFIKASLASAAILASNRPEGLVGLPNDGFVDLSWSEFDGAESYNIYKDDVETPYANISDGTTYQDINVTNGTEYSYYMTAVLADANGTVKHDASTCIGCKSCILADPYGVIHFNKTDPHAKWDDKKELIPGCTSSPNEIHTKTKSEFPHYNPDRSKTYAGVRYKGIVEKCTFCDHRTKFGQKPFCVSSCPADARIFGDLNDAKSEISILLKNNKYSSLKPEKGTNPKVYYIGL